VRQSNFCNPATGQAAITISPIHYDKRALTCTDPLSLTNSLFNLSYMTSVSTLRIADVLASDGGLELIVRILKRLGPTERGPPGQPHNALSAHPLSRFAYSAALTCLCNVAIRGNQRLRRRLVDAGIVTVIRDLLVTVPQELAANVAQPGRAQGEGRREGGGAAALALSQQAHYVNDILLAVKIVAYLSKYHSVRTAFHSGYPPHNVFQLIEPLTSSLMSTEVRRWAVICMRNAFKRDSGTGEEVAAGEPSLPSSSDAPRQFSKCSRCRRVTYCSKICQRSAWPLHKNWCLK
ncbi:hypothetical protein BDK51DRAFT_13231, partial [Blyttiomyces helicus]